MTKRKQTRYKRAPAASWGDAGEGKHAELPEGIRALIASQQAQIEALASALGVRDKAPTLPELWAKGETALQATIRPRSFIAYRARVRAVLSYVGPLTTVPATDITLSDVHAYGKWRLQHGITPMTVNHEITAIVRLLNLALENRWIRSYPLPRRLKKFRGEKVRRETIYTGKQVEEILAYFQEQKDVHMVAMTLGVLYAGFRPIEVLTMERTRLDRENRVYDLPGERSKNHRGIRRVLPVPFYFALLDIPPVDGSTFFFANPETKRPFAQSSMGERWRKMRAALGLRGHQGEKADLYSMRHTLGTWAARKFGRADLVKEMLRHEDIRTTQRYMHADEAEVTSALESLAHDRRPPVRAEPTKEENDDEMHRAIDGKRD